MLLEDMGHHLLSSTTAKNGWLARGLSNIEIQNYVVHDLFLSICFFTHPYPSQEGMMPYPDVPSWEGAGVGLLG